MADNNDQYDEVVKQVSKVFEQYSTRDHLEIEGKIGRYYSHKKTFESGVSEDWFKKCDELLSLCKTWTNGSNAGVWVTSYDYFLDNNIRVTKTSSGNFIMRKVLLKHIDIHCADRPYQIRVSLKEEMPIDIKLPQLPHKVRVKMRKSYVYKNKWRFDLTKVWTGPDEQSAQMEKPSYEIECEYVAPDRRNSAGPDYLYTAASLLQKLFDMLDPQRKHTQGAKPKLTLIGITDPTLLINPPSSSSANSNSNNNPNKRIKR